MSGSVRYHIQQLGKARQYTLEPLDNSEIQNNIFQKYRSAWGASGVNNHYAIIFHISDTHGSAQSGVLDY